VQRTTKLIEVVTAVFRPTPSGL